MNAFFFVILVAVLIEYVLDVVANVLNLRAMKPEMPAALQDVYKPDEYRKSQEYTRATTRFGLVTSTFSLVVLLGFWFVGGFNFLDEVVRGWELHVILTGVLYVGILVVAYFVVSLPFSIYSTFVIEERFGFNKTTPRTFVTDLLKGLALAAVIGVPVLAGVLAFFEYAGSLAWLYCWIAVTLFTLALEFVAPTWIMPIFNKFTPLEAGNLRDAIFQYAKGVDFTVSNIFVIDGSKRFHQGERLFHGLWPQQAHRALRHPGREAHRARAGGRPCARDRPLQDEAHPTRHRHPRGQYGRGLFSCCRWCWEARDSTTPFFMNEQSIYTGLLFFALLYTPVNVVLSVVMQVVSRKHEYEADRWSAETYEEPASLVKALKKLSAENLSNLEPHPVLRISELLAPAAAEQSRGHREAQAGGSRRFRN